MLKTWRKWKALASLRRPFGCSNSIIHAGLISIHGVKCLLVHFSLPLNLSAFTPISNDDRLMMCNEAHINTPCFCPQYKNPPFLLVVYSLHTELKAGWVCFFPSSTRDFMHSRKSFVTWELGHACERNLACSPGTFLHHLNTREIEEEQGKASSSSRLAQPPKTQNKPRECSDKFFWVKTSSVSQDLMGRKRLHKYFAELENIFRSSACKSHELPSTRRNPSTLWRTEMAHLSG